MSLLNYQWPKEKYDCVVGVWSLSSIPYEAVENLLVSIDQSLKVPGYLVLIDPVLEHTEQQTERAAEGGYKQYMVRPARSYTHFFKSCEFKIIDSLRFWWKDYCPEAQMLFVLKKEI